MGRARGLVAIISVALAAAAGAGVVSTGCQEHRTEGASADEAAVPETAADVTSGSAADGSAASGSSPATNDMAEPAGPPVPEVPTAARDPFGEDGGDGTEPYGGEPTQVQHEFVLGDAAQTAGIGGTKAAEELRRAIADIEGQGYHVGIMLSDLDGNELLSYDADRAMYPASAAKGPYVLAVWEQNVGGGEAGGYLTSLTDAILGWSDNDSYHAMRETYGDAPIAALADEAGCDLSWYGGSTWDWANWYYPRTSPRDMARMWVHEAAYLLGEGDGPAALREMMAEREVSPIRDAMPRGAATLAKAGWLPEGGDYDSTPAAVDVGIVRWEGTGRSYVVAIMTDTPEDMDAVRAVAAALDRCYLAAWAGSGGRGAE